MTLRFTILASGSTGNSLLVEKDGTKVLVDAGLSAKKIEQLMEERDVRASELDAIFITHEHSDHVKGVGALARKHDLPSLSAKALIFDGWRNANLGQPERGRKMAEEGFAIQREIGT